MKKIGAIIIVIGLIVLLLFYMLSRNAAGPVLNLSYSGIKEVNLEKYKRRSVSDFVQRFGPPNYVRNMEGGGESWTYINDRSNDPNKPPMISIIVENGEITAIMYLVK